MWQFALTPSGPDYSVDWERVRKSFAWIRAMARVPQDPEWHAEGDVEVHTRMVAQAMAGDSSWRALPAGDRDVLFASALLHDVAKPICTKEVEGRWTSPRHAKVGRPMSRNILWRGEAGESADFPTRERIANLVRYHGLPLRFLDKPDPARAVIEASLEVNLRELAMLALADVRGRICHDQASLLEMIKMFVAFCEELECLNGPKHFESDHHRFMYCMAKKPYEYVPYDPPGFEVTLMSGLPGSGKSNWVKENAGDLPVINLDQLRGEMEVDPAKMQAPVIEAARARAKEMLRQKQPFIWDATNTSKDLRSALLALFANYGARTRVVYVDAPWDELLRRNRGRVNPVPERVILGLADKLEMPTAGDAHRVEYVTGEGIS